MSTILGVAAILSTLLRRVGHAASNKVTDVQLSIYHGRNTPSLLMKDARPPKSSVSRHDFQASTTTGVSCDDLGNLTIRRLQNIRTPTRVWSSEALS
jgi:hypothetical protein